MGGCNSGKASTSASPCSPLNSRGFGGSIVGSGGGGGGGGDCPATNPEFQTIYQENFATLPDQSFAVDGAYNINGKTWNLYNRALATDASVGSSTGGLCTDIAAATVRNYFSGRNSPYWTLTFAEMLAGSPFEGVPSTELRIAAKWSIVGGFTGANNNIYYGCQSRVQSGNYYHWLYQGLNDRGFYNSIPTPQIGGSAAISFASLGYYPNVARISFLGSSLRKTEYSSAVAASIDTATMIPAQWTTPTSAANTPFIVPGSNNNMEFFITFNADNVSNTATRARLEEIKVEARINPYLALIFLM